MYSLIVQNVAGALTAAGDIPYASAPGLVTNLPIGAANAVMRSTGTAPQWTTSLQIDSSGNISIGGSPIATGSPKLSLPSVSNIAGISLLSTNTGSWTSIDLGRVSAQEFRIGIAGGANHFFTGTVAGDGALVTNTGSGKLFIGTASGASALILATNGSERVRVDSSGRVGIGATPAALGSGHRGVQIGAQGWLFSDAAAGVGANHWLTENLYYDGTNWKYITTDAASLFQVGASGQILFYTAASGTAGANATIVNTWKITSAGHLLAGTDNSYNIGDSAATSRPGIIYVANVLFVGGTTYSANQDLILNMNRSVGASSDGYHQTINGTYTKTATTGNLGGISVNTGITVNTSVTCDRVTQLILAGITATVNGTLTNHNALYIGTPSGGTTVRVIDTASGAYLTTGGTWTNNPSWDRYKVDKKPLARTTVRGWLDWMAVNHVPAFYRHDGRPLDEGREDSPRPIHQGYEHDTLFFSLDHWPEDMRQAITVDPQGGVGTKDTDGLLLALVAEQAARHNELGAEIARLRAELQDRRN